MRRRTALAALGACAASLTLASPAFATFPGENGAIAFSRGGDIWSVNPDGTGEKRLTSGADHLDESPEWSADGRTIYFQRAKEGERAHIYRMSADGSGVTLVRQGAAPQLSINNDLAFLGDHPETGNSAAYVGEKLIHSHERLVTVDDWAPNHSLLLVTERDHDSFFMADSPSGTQTLYGFLHDERHFHNFHPSYSPDGARIAFSTRASGISGCDDMGDPTCGGDPDAGIRTMDIAGGDLRTVFHGDGITPAWSPDGRLIVFEQADQLRIIGADGKGLRPLVAGADPDWQPLSKAPLTPPGRTVTVTVPVEVPGPERVVEKVVTHVVQGAACAIPRGKRLTLTLRATRAIKKGQRVKVTVYLKKGAQRVRLAPRQGVR